MPVVIQPTSVIKAKLGVQENGPVHAFFTHTCRLHMDRFIPYSGPTKRVHLRENVVETPSYIIYETPYAHAQYVGFTTGPVVNYTTPGTGPYWDQRMWSAEGRQVTKEVQHYVDTHGGS